MLVQKLLEYAERLDLPPTLYSLEALRYIIELDDHGRLLSPRMTDLADPASPRTRGGQKRLLPKVRRTSSDRPLLLADKADYVLGYSKEPHRAEDAKRRHEKFVDIVRRCAEQTGDHGVQAVLTFLSGHDLAHVVPESDFNPSGIITFRVDGAFPIDLASVRTFWADQNATDEDAPMFQCIGCGRERPVLSRLLGAIKGIPGPRAETSLISANEEAFESYGLKASLIAPTCADCGERFTKAANDLLGGEKSRFVVGGAAFIFWTREATDFDFFSLITRPDADEVRAQFEALFGGRKPVSLDENRFYATSLSGSGGRAVVRDWIDTTVGEVKDKLSLWFRRQAIVDPFGGPGRPVGLAALAGATVRQLSDVPRPTTRSLVHAALTGEPLPWDLMHQAVRRIRAQQADRERGQLKVTRVQAALIKLVLCGQLRNSELEDSMIKLDQDNENPAYRCGRLLAVLEQAQRQAIPGINATVVDRYFGMASSAPDAVFPRLVRGAQPHLGKLERDNRGAYVALQRRLEEILGGLGLRKAGALYTGFPSTLTLREQGLFSLGYYHQRAFDSAQRRGAAERRRALGQPADDEESEDETTLA
jgi:CRISPR-associated protein Csd1